MASRMEVTKLCSKLTPKLEFFTTFSHNKGSSNHHQKSQRNTSARTMSWSLESPRIRQCEAMASSDQELDPYHPQEGEEGLIEDKNTSDELQKFVAREASLSEEYYGAAWLRAEIHFEVQPNLRHLNTFKKQFAEQEYMAITRRSKMQFGHESICIIMVRNEEKNWRESLLEGLVGTVDVYIRTFLHRETFPRESIETQIYPFVQNPDSMTYSYVANLCVAKPARRQGVASTMMRLAVQHSIANGVDRVYVHVARSNKPALQFYNKMGFQVVEEANLELEKQQLYLLCLKT